MSDEQKIVVICGCSGTTIGQIQALLAQGVVDMDRLSRITGAGSGCGGCEFDLQALLQGRRNPAQKS